MWRFGIEIRGGGEEQAEHAERRAAGMVGWTLLLLGSTAWGIAIAAAALIVMPMLVVIKRRIAHRIGSHALKADAAEGIVCAYMAAVLLVGFVLRTVFGWWWTDPVSALGYRVFYRAGRARSDRGIAWR